MEKIQVRDELKKEYIALVQTAQQMEQSLGQSEYRLYKLKKQREQIDIDLKTWWDNVAVEYNFDKSKDYYVDSEGAINQVEKPEAPAPAAEVKETKEPVDLDAIPTQPTEEAPKDDKAGGSAADLT